ncbi:hypothetical protein [Streptomyces sp. NPDC048650]|uniref:hypothetical protein n=1 Tax=unclassified Streptomyces TaxID=2593676 RepID=UPI0037160A4A
MMFVPLLLPALMLVLLVLLDHYEERVFGSRSPTPRIDHHRKRPARSSVRREQVEVLATGPTMARSAVVSFPAGRGGHRILR